MASNVQGILNTAQQWVNEQVPYLWGGVSQLGADCSGFVQTIFGQYGVSLPRTSQEQANVGTQIPYSAAQPGDLLFYNYEGNNSHVAIYAGNGTQYAETGPNGAPAVLQSVDMSALDKVTDPFTGGNSGGAVAPTTGSTATNLDSQEASLASFVQTGSTLDSDTTTSAHKMLIVVGGLVVAIIAFVEIGGASDQAANGIIAVLVAAGIWLTMNYIQRGSSFLQEYGL